MLEIKASFGGYQGVTPICLDFDFAATFAGTNRILRPCVMKYTITDRLRKAVGHTRTGSPIVGIGDDCAIYRPRGSADDLLFTSDMFIEGVHFLRETHKAAVAREEGPGPQFERYRGHGRHTAILSGVALRADGPILRWVDRFLRRLLEPCGRHRTVLAGGDLRMARSWPAM